MGEWMHNEVLQAIPATLYLPQFGLDFPVMRVAGMGDYFPVRAFCKRIGLASQPQLERLQSDASYAGGLETFTVPTAGGPQDALCIRKKELAWWIASLEPRTVRKLEERFGIPLGEFKQAVMDAADRLWWGIADTSSARMPHGAEPAGAFFLHCRRCGARHRLELQGHAVLWGIDEE
jgi:hypothetical protein